MSHAKKRPATPRRRRWLVEALEDRAAPSDTLLLLGSLAVALQPKPRDALPGAAHTYVAEIASSSPTRATNALFISRPDPAATPRAAPVQQDSAASHAVDQIFTSEFVNLAAELSLGLSREEVSPAPVRSSAKPLVLPAGTNAAPAPGGTAGAGGSGGGGGGGGAGIDGAAAAMGASASAAAAAPATSAHSTTTASAADNSVMRTSVSPAGYIPPPPVANDDDLDTYHDTPLVETDPGIVENDDPNIQSCVLDTSPTMGQISYWDGQGGFTYTPYYHDYGTDYLTYHNVDYYGQSSNEATVTIHVVENAPEALPDGTYWGGWNKTAASGNTITVSAADGVLANDNDQDGPESGNLQAVKDSDPANGTLTLNPDGSFIYTPNPGFGGYDQFTYHATDGILNSASVVVSLAVQKVDIDVGNSQQANPNNPTFLADSLENSQGVFTVANWNDTNGNTTEDDYLSDNPVTATPAGRDEVDFIPIRINQPVPMPDPTGDVTLSFYNTSVNSAAFTNIWSSSVKGTLLAQGAGVKAPTTYSIEAQDIPAGGLTVWAELTRPSVSQRDYLFTLTYGQFDDSANATAVWATVTAIVTAQQTGAEIAAQFPDMDPQLAARVSDGGGTGQQGPFQNGADNLGFGKGAGMGMVIQYTIQPGYGPNDPTWESQGVYFDATRQLNSYGWDQANPGGSYVPVNYEPWPAKVELPNDDAGEKDESSIVTAENHFYARDRPGVTSYFATQNDRILQQNCQDFLRVGTNGSDPKGDVEAGSRCSEYQPWYARVDLDKDPKTGVWSWDPTGKNDIGTGNVQLQTTSP